jgi:hypothetical protein
LVESIALLGFQYCRGKLQVLKEDYFCRTFCFPKATGEIPGLGAFSKYLADFQELRGASPLERKFPNNYTK